MDQAKVSGKRSMTCKHMFNYVRGIQVREDSAISMALIVDEEVLRNRPRHLESCDVEAVLPKEDFGTEKAGHSLQFANGTSKLRKICRVANDTLRLTSHDARTEQTSHEELSQHEELSRSMKLGHSKELSQGEELSQSEELDHSNELCPNCEEIGDSEELGQSHREKLSKSEELGHSEVLGQRESKVLDQSQSKELSQSEDC